MQQDAHRHQVARATAAVRRLGEAVCGARAFFIYRDRSDPSQPAVIACHPPLTDHGMLACLGNAHVVWAPVSDGDAHLGWLALATNDGFVNKELASELTLLAAQSLSRRVSMELPAATDTSQS